MKKSLLALGVATMGLGLLAAPAQAADHVSINLAFGYPQPVVQEVYVAHPQCRRHPRWHSCYTYYHQAYGRHYHGRRDPHWHR